MVNTFDLEEQKVARLYPDIYNELIPLLKRNESGILDAYLKEVCFDVNIDNTRTQAHCHFIMLDGNKRPRVKDFARFIAEKIIDFAIPRSEVRRAIEESNRIISTAPIAKLNTKARNLFTRLPKSGEGGEVLLSLMAETFLRIPQMLTKMVLKTNTEMHVHGSDGIHVGVNKSNGNLIIYWGESKLYSDPATAVRECFASLSPFLLDTGGSGASQERDLQLVRENIDLDNPELEEALKKFLNPDDPFFNHREYHGLCLVGFDTDAYPAKPNTKELEHLRQEIQLLFHERKNHIKSRISAEQIERFDIQLFCLPFPSVEEFRQAFRKELGLTNE